MVPGRPQDSSKMAPRQPKSHPKASLGLPVMFMTAVAAQRSPQEGPMNTPEALPGSPMDDAVSAGVSAALAAVGDELHLTPKQEAQAVAEPAPAAWQAMHPVAGPSARHDALGDNVGGGGAAATP